VTQDPQDKLVNNKSTERIESGTLDNVNERPKEPVPPQGTNFKQLRADINRLPKHSRQESARSSTNSDNGSTRHVEKLQKTARGETLADKPAKPRRKRAKKPKPDVPQANTSK